MRYIGVTHGRQFTGGVFAGVSMHARAVRDDLSILVQQQLRSEFFDFFRGDVQCTREMRLAVAFRRKRLDKFDMVLSAEHEFQVFGGNGAFHVHLLEDRFMLLRAAAS